MPTSVSNNFDYRRSNQTIVSKIDAVYSVNMEITNKYLQNLELTFKPRASLFFRDHFLREDV